LTRWPIHRPRALPGGRRVGPRPPAQRLAPVLSQREPQPAAYYGGGGPYAAYGGPGYYGGPGAWSQDYASRNGIICQPGTMVRLDDGLMHRCQ